jgi:hypothetical protein
MIIGFLGRKRNGKDTCADYLVEKYDCIKIAFADPIKEIIKILFNLSDEQLYGDKKEEVDVNWGVSPRNIMQFIGTEIFRNKIGALLPEIKDDFWVKSFEAKIKHMDNNKIILVSDVRFQNEVDVIKKLGGIIIKVERPAMKMDYDAHISESLIDNITNYNYLIKNDKTLELLYIELESVVNKYIKK